MCHLTTETKLTRKTVYKICHKVNGNYFGMFAGMLIEKGPVLDEECWRNKRPDDMHYSSYNTWDYLFNVLAVGRCSGFSSKRSIKNYFHSESAYYNKTFGVTLAVLKMTLGGSIVKGDARGIAGMVSDKALIYAGTEIIDFEEIKI